jgi:hypothetical protein
MRNKIFTYLIFFLLLFESADTFAQCALCRRVAETGQNESSKKGLNAGILYLLSIPYLMGGVGAFVWYRNRKKDSTGREE